MSDYRSISESSQVQLNRENCPIYFIPGCQMRGLQALLGRRHEDFRAPPVFGLRYPMSASEGAPRPSRQWANGRENPANAGSKSQAAAELGSAEEAPTVGSHIAMIRWRMAPTSASPVAALWCSWDCSE